MNGWVITYLVLLAVNFGIGLAKHGQCRTGKYSAWEALFEAGVVVFVFYKAGLFG